MYKLVAIDLDGTMLNSYGEVTENTSKTIKTIISGTISFHSIWLLSAKTIVFKKHARGTKIKHTPFLFIFLFL